MGSLIPSTMYNKIKRSKTPLDSLNNTSLFLIMGKRNTWFYFIVIYLI